MQFVAALDIAISRSTAVALNYHLSVSFQLLNEAKDLQHSLDKPGKQDLHHALDQTHEVPQIDVFQALLTDVLEHDLNQYRNSFVHCGRPPAFYVVFATNISAKVSHTR
jgi:hypothetical protein